jgi:23S rRNA (pseudouridine1915-N3)-methyltransferase
LQVDIIAVGKIREAYIATGIHQYMKRLRAYGRFAIREIKEESYRDPLTTGQMEQVLQAEGERLLAAVPPDSFVVALTPEGRLYSSPELAKLMGDLIIRGQSRFAFLIGGSLGLSPEVLNRADLRLSFSPLTFPHQLFRLMLVEQLYRAATILRGEPYHR